MIIFYYLINLISPISTDMCVMNFIAHYYWQINHDKIFTHTD